ncbi:MULTISPECIES: ligand-binding sensor domain-containing protein [Rhodonellum]|uniref:Ligand-binding sensor domain-containing protein n=1 Tax=Rhodonellum ikkaensis TaxID=336829 RepID=A0A1H3RHS8_9BACT|nr:MULTISPECIES: two-component regulator propeller domain-containing protein [Rhodonellum]SDZ25133.1 ligand-binding sensor domain-containing protein [Rhodonellum ikkaensis]
MNTRNTQVLTRFNVSLLWLLVFFPVATLLANDIQGLYPMDSSLLETFLQEKNYVVETWDNSNGLPQNAVYAMGKDNTGFLWLATEEGLTRLDGSSAKVFDQENNPQMLEQTYYTFFKTKSGIWASGDRSIALLEKNIQKVVDCAHITENSWIRGISEDERGNIWISNREGQIHLWKDGVFEELDYWKPEGPLEMLSLFHLGNSQMIAGTTKGLYIINYVTETVRLISSEDFIGNRIFGTPENVFIANPENGIYRLGKDFNLQLENAITELRDLNLSSLTTDSSNRIWASSTEKGLIMIENGKVNRFYYPEINNYPVRKLIHEKDILYLGTHGKGLVVIKPAKVKQPNHPELQQKNIKAIFSSDEQSIWVGTKSEGVYRIKNRKITSISTSDGLIQNGVNTIGANKNQLYVGSTSGISVIDVVSEKVINQITQDDGLASNYVNAILGDSEARVWILTRYGGLHYLDQKQQLQKVELPAKFSNTNFIGIMELKNKDILIGSIGQGVFRLVDGKFAENLILPLAPGENVIYCMVEDQDGDLWFGSHGGIVLYSKGEFKRIKKSQGLKSQSVFSMTRDERNGMWISNNFGVQYISPQELKRFKESQDEDFFISSILYDQSQGMPNAETNGLISPSALKDATGKIWIPTVEGVGIIDPSEIILEKQPINFQWDELVYGEKKIPIDKKILIPAGENMFQVSFNCIDFQNPHQYTLFYRIGGENNAWLPVKNQRQFFFNGLKPGNYLLEIQVLKYGKIESIQSIPIEVEAFFFETKSFKILSLVFLCLLTYFIVKYYLNIKMKIDLETQVNQRTLELRDTNHQLKQAVREIETQNTTLKEITWNQSHLVRAPLTKAMGINQLLINYPKYAQIGKSREELEKEMLTALQQLDAIVRETHRKSENLGED